MDRTPTFSRVPVQMLALAGIVTGFSACPSSSSPPTPVPSNTGIGSTGSSGPIVGPPAACAPVTAGAPTTNVTTFHNDLARTGQYLSETTLNRTNVNSTTFGKIAGLPVDGLVFAQPLVMNGVSVPGVGTKNLVFVVTEHDSVYAFDTQTLSPTPVWHRNFASDCLSSPATPSNCRPASDIDVGAPNIAPEIGITATPVIDPASGVMYVTAITKEGSNFYWRIHALSIATGAETAGSPITMSGVVVGTGDGENTGGVVTFNAINQLSRAGLVLSNGVVYVAFTSFDDQEPAHGWILSYSAVSGSTPMRAQAVWNSTPNGGEGTIWQAGGAPAVDSSCNLYFATGNGDPINGYANESPSETDYADSVLKLGVFTQGLAATDYFTPYNYQALDNGDVEIGSGGVLLLPDQPGSHPHLMVAGGKQGTVYLLDRDNLGKLNSAANATADSQIVQELVGDIPGGANAGPGLYGIPSYYNNAVFFGAAGDYLRAIPLANGLLNWSGTTHSGIKIVRRGVSTSISANGVSEGIVWYIDPSAYTYSWTSGDPTTVSYGPGVLYAFSTDNLATPLYASNQVAADEAACPTSANNTPGSGAGCAVKFAVPTIADGLVYVGTNTEISVYGLRSSKPSTAVASANAFRSLASAETPHARPPSPRALHALDAIFNHSPNSCDLHPASRANGAIRMGNF